MTAVADVELHAATGHGLVARAGDPKREGWLDQVRRTGACRHPVRLRGVVLRGDQLVYSTAREPDGALMVRCGNRREACCPSCAHEYRGDMWQLVYAGLASGRKGVPEQVAEHPQVFATPTAPSFGPVHTRRDDGPPCRCGNRHEADDTSSVRRSTGDVRLRGCGVVELARPGAVEPLHRRAGPRPRRPGRCQRTRVVPARPRGVRQGRRVPGPRLVHFHVIVRLDGAEDHATAPGVTVSPEQLCDATEPDGWRERGVPEQLVRMAYGVLRISERAELRRLAGWVHMLGFRGHFVTKSRGYSTTLGAARAAYRAGQDEPDEVVDDDSTAVLSFWEYLGSGYLNPGDALLAAGVAASLHAAREALLEVRRGRPSDWGACAERNSHGRWRLSRSPWNFTVAIGDQ
jgi:replication initiator protein RepSA